MTTWSSNVAFDKKCFELFLSYVKSVYRGLFFSEKCVQSQYIEDFFFEKSVHIEDLLQLGSNFAFDNESLELFLSYVKPLYRGLFFF